MTFEDMVKLFYFMTFIPKSHILAIFLFFLHVSALLKVFLTELEKMNKMKKLHMTLEDVIKYLYFMTFIHKPHILAEKKIFFYIFYMFRQF